ncbi:MAG: TetR/AcrR family transcriptional regulator [Dehalococcoidales bacterium]|nr:TetR/AcrR family transcriptional regulator [Dehalococcoidales bacterium]
MKREDRKKRVTMQRREQILEAALLVFSQRGYDRATIPDVAREAGVAVGTIYNYYPGKRDLLVAITNKYIIEPFSNITKKSRTKDDATLITQLMENRLNFGLEGVNKFLPLFGEVQRDPEIRRSYAEKVVRPVMAMMEEYVTSRVKKGAFRDVNPKVVTRAIGGMVVGFMLLYQIEGENSPVKDIDRQYLAAELAGLVLRGMQKT